jgi:hypothetical protein
MTQSITASDFRALKSTLVQEMESRYLAGSPVLHSRDAKVIMTARAHAHSERGLTIHSSLKKAFASLLMIDRLRRREAYGVSTTLPNGRSSIK